jgi:hypothetical protein
MNAARRWTASRGRIYCSQMTSCAEATYFLQNCPGTKMDGDNDGIPCEEQWCNSCLALHGTSSRDAYDKEEQ